MVDIIDMETTYLYRTSTTFINTVLLAQPAIKQLGFICFLNHNNKKRVDNKKSWYKMYSHS